MSDLEYSAMSQEQLLYVVQDKDAEIERLRDALKEIDECLCGNWSRREMRQIARSALEDDDV